VGVHEECDVFFAGAEMGKLERDGEAAFAWALHSERSGFDH
jgi:hypothetical protein